MFAIVFIISIYQGAYVEFKSKIFHFKYVAKLPQRLFSNNVSPFKPRDKPPS